jgi:hypothetical protein
MICQLLNLRMYYLPADGFSKSYLRSTNWEYDSCEVRSWSRLVGQSVLSELARRVRTKLYSDCTVPFQPQDLRSACCGSAGIIEYHDISLNLHNHLAIAWVSPGHGSRNHDLDPYLAIPITRVGQPDPCHFLLSSKCCKL